MLASRCRATKPWPAAVDPSARYTTAQSLIGLCSGIAAIDLSIGGLKQGTVTMLTGTDVRKEVAERCCARVQLSRSLGGLGRCALIIDGGNSFDIYLLSSAAREYGLKINDALENVFISRAFTPYELRQLVCIDSGPILRARTPGLLVVSDVFELFGDDLDKWEAQAIMRKVGSAIDRMIVEHKLAILMTSATIPRHLVAFVGEHCDVVLDATQGERGLTLKLSKHPSKQPFETVAEAHTNLYNQRALR